MKRLTLVAALAALALVGGTADATAAEPTSPSTTAVAAAQPEATDANASFVEAEPSFFSESSEATCEDFGFFAADKKTDCDKTCKKGNKCQRKQVCGDGQCPPPGYCWKCPN